MPSAEAEMLISQVEQLEKSAHRYFVTAKSEVAELYPPGEMHPYGHGDIYWTGVSEELQAQAAKTIDELVALADTLTGAVKASPVLGEADEQQVAHAVKKMRAALRLRRHRYWDTEVLHDEGTVLGVRRAGQDESEALQPSDAERVFQAAKGELLSVVELVGYSRNDATVVSARRDCLRSWHGIHHDVDESRSPGIDRCRRPP